MNILNVKKPCFSIRHKIVDQIKLFLVVLLVLQTASVTAQCTIQSWVGSAAIPDNNLTGVSQTVTISDTTPITDVNIIINITHTWDADLSVTLTSPVGTTITLTSNNGGGGDNYSDTAFDDAASTNITAGSAPFNGAYIPEQALSNFNGENPSGIWTLTVVDDTGADTGTLNSFSVEVCPGSPDAPPTVIASGNQDYCPEPGNTVNIATSVSITDPDDTSTTAVYIQISSGYVNGEDLLTLTGVHPNITSSWDAIQGELTLSGPALYTEFETAVLAVEYSNSSTSATGIRQFSITVGEANYLPSTGHYYEYVPSLGITWTSAKAAAAARTYFGLQGYLATLTSQVEADFSGTQAVGVGWIGASDAVSEGAAAEGDWKWVTGPEAGISFWSGAAGGSTTPPFNFAFWNGGEPNNCCGGEDYAHITHPNTNPNGSWNDLSNTGAANPSSNYHPQGYVVEYGGMPGDPILNITAITQITIICKADLSLRKTVNNASPNQGDTIIFTLTVTNQGPDTPTHLQVEDILPVGVTFISASPATGTATYDAATRTLAWSLGAYILGVTAGVDNTIALTYNVRVDNCGEFTNQAEITSSSLSDPDSTMNNDG